MMLDIGFSGIFQKSFYELNMLRAIEGIHK